MISAMGSSTKEDIHKNVFILPDENHTVLDECNDNKLYIPINEADKESCIGPNFPRFLRKRRTK